MVAMARIAVCLSLWLFVSQVRGLHIPSTMNRTIQNLLQYYTIQPQDRFNGRPVFSREPLSGKMETKLVFMGGVLETYEELIGRMLNQLPTPSPPTTDGGRPAAGSPVTSGAGGDVHRDLAYILKMIHGLKKNYKEQEKLLQGLNSLKEIQMDNRVVQSKALWELPWLYEEASLLSNTVMQRRRRRRQTKNKTHLRA